MIDRSMVGDGDIALVVDGLKQYLQEFRTEGLLEMLSDRVEGKNILLARAEEARSVLPDELVRLGAKVEVASAYRTVTAVEGAIAHDGADWITFASSSTVKNFIDGFGREILRSIKVAAIGPITAATLREFDREPDVVAKEYTIDGLVEALVEYVRSEAQ